MKRYVMTKDKIIRLATPQDNLNAAIDKTSDNLIDLLEVGDCVEMVDKEIYSIVDKADLLAFAKDTKVVAIWKRNGDIMRRYEICPSK